MYVFVYSTVSMILSVSQSHSPLLLCFSFSFFIYYLFNDQPVVYSSIYIFYAYTHELLVRFLLKNYLCNKREKKYEKKIINNSVH